VPPREKEGHVAADVDVEELKQALSAGPDTLPGLPGSAGLRQWPWLSIRRNLGASAKLPEYRRLRSQQRLLGQVDGDL